MNKREIAEIKKINKFSSDGCTIGRMCIAGSFFRTDSVYGIGAYT